MDERTLRKIDRLPDYSIMHEIAQIEQTAMTPIFCLYCHSFLRWGLPGETPENSPNRAGKDWFCCREHLYFYATIRHVEIRKYDLKAMVNDLTKR